jgi:hypothetical protein
MEMDEQTPIIQERKPDPRHEALRILRDALVQTRRGTISHRLLSDAIHHLKET